MLIRTVSSRLLDVSSAKSCSKDISAPETSFHCSVVKPYHPNDDQPFPARAYTKPAPILIDDEKGWEVETILDHKTRHGRGQFLVKWKGYPNGENSWEPVKGLENAEDLVQAWWTNNMSWKEFLTVFSGYITVCFSCT